jgi:hypothetical protein
MPRKKAAAEVVTTSEIPAEVIGAAVLADLAQIEADAATHPDTDARARIIKAVTRLRDIAEGKVSADLAGAVKASNDRALLDRVSSIQRPIGGSLEFADRPSRKWPGPWP